MLFDHMLREPNLPIDHGTIHAPILNIIRIPQDTIPTRHSSVNSHGLARAESEIVHILALDRIQAPFTLDCVPCLYIFYTAIHDIGHILTIHKTFNTSLLST